MDKIMSTKINLNELVAKYNCFVREHAQYAHVIYLHYTFMLSTFQI